MALASAAMQKAFAFVSGVQFVLAKGRARVSA
jgi:hypothetical protein